MDYSALLKEYNEVRAQIMAAEAKSAELNKAMKVITDAEDQKIVNLAAKKSKKYRAAWAENAGYLKWNVSNILESCYETLQDVEQVGEVVAENAKKLGGVDTTEWREFVFKIIQHLFKKKAFDEEDGSIDTFEDTAGGCDEVVWNTAQELLGPKAAKA